MYFKKLFKSKLFTISNFLSMSRVILIPFIWFFWDRSETQPRYFPVVLIIACIMILTDFLDGFLARRLGQETPIGQYLDPIADKIAILSILFFLNIYRDFPLLVIIIIIFREIMGIWLGTFLLLKRNTLGQPNYWGKSGVFLFSIVGFIYFFKWEYRHWSLIPLLFVFLGGMIAYGRAYWDIAFKRK